MDPERERLLKQYTILLMLKKHDEASKFLSDHEDDPELMMGCQVINEVTRKMKTSGPIGSIPEHLLPKEILSSMKGEAPVDEPETASTGPKSETQKKDPPTAGQYFLGFVVLLLFGFFVGAWGALVSMGYRLTMWLVGAE